MDKTCLSCGYRLSEQRDDHEFPEFQRGGGHGPTERRKVILVAFPDLLDESVGAQTLQEARELRARVVGQVLAELPRLEAADGELAAEDRAEQVEVGAVEQVEAAVAPLPLVDRGGELLDGAEAGARVLDGREKVEVPEGSRPQEVPEDRQAVDRLADGGELELRGPVPVFHRTVVGEKGDIVRRALDPGDEPELVVELEGGRAHVVLDPGALDPGREVIPQFILVPAGELAPQEGGDVVRLHGVDGGGGEGCVERLEVGLALEDDI